MNCVRSKRVPILIVLFLLVLATTGCGQVSGASNFTLPSGETISGPLVLFSNNAIIEKDSQVEGPVLMLCCNLIVDGYVAGSILLISGNIRVDANASVNGDVNVISGNVAR